MTTAKVPAAKQEKKLRPYDLGMERLAESGMNGADAKLLGLSFLTPKETKELSPGFKDRPAMKLPYFDAKGSDTGFYRLRYLGKPEGIEGAQEKPQRYTQPPDTQPGLYLARGVPWPELAQNTHMPLWITEGEIKAAVACKLGVACVGLGGVYSWRSAKSGMPLLPALEEFEWKGRDVYLAFDSDLRTNPQVLRALLALAKELTHRGARISMLELPDGRGGKKQGIDDFYMARGAEALMRLVDEAVPFSASSELWVLNAEVTYIKDPGLVIVLSDGRKLAPRAFKEHAYSNRFYWESGIDKEDKPTLQKKPIAEAWLKWEHRAELERLTYAPGHGRITESREYNYWPGWGCEPKRGNIGPWKALLDYMFAADPAARKWFEQWCAWPLQNPGGKLYSAVVVWGIQTGTGKSLIGYSLMKIYGANSSEVSDQDISSPFNEWAENRQFVMGDDVAGSEHKKGTADRLKFMITRQQVRLNPKYIPSYAIPDRINYYFNSNHPDAFFVEDADRRYFVWEAPALPMPQDFYREYDKWLRGNGPSALFYHLMHLDMAGFDPKGRAMETGAKRAMVRDSKSDLADWVMRLREHPDTVLKVGSVAVEGDLFSTGRLLALYDPESKGRVSSNGMGRELKRAGFRQVNNAAVVLTPTGPQRLYAIRNQGKWLAAKTADIVAYLAALANPSAKKSKY